MPYFLALMLIIFFTQLNSSMAPGAATSPPVKVRLQLRFDHQFQFAGFYAAKWLGYYEKAGLDVEILDGLDDQGRQLDVTRTVMEGNAEFGLGSSDILLANDAGAELIILYTVMQQSPVALFLKQNPSISSPAQIAGLRIQTSQNEVVDVEIAEMLRAEGVDPKFVNFVRHDSIRPIKTHLEDLFSGKVDGTLGYSLSIPWLARQREFPLQTIRPSSYGVDFYGDSVFTTRSFLESNRELVNRFLAATTLGWDYAMRNQEAVIRHIMSEWPTTLIYSERQRYNEFLASEMRRLMLYPAVEPGHINRKRWQTTVDTLRRSGVIKNPLDANDFVYIESEYERLQKEKRQQSLYLALISILLASTVFTALWIFVQKRRQEREKLRRALFLDEALTGIATCDLNLRIIEFNAAAEELTGWLRQEVIGQSFSQLCFPNNLKARNEIESASQHSKASGVSRVSITKNQEFVIQHKDGHLIPVMMSMAKFNLGTECFHTASFSDLRQVKKLADEKNRLARIIESSTDLIFIFTSAGEVIYGNPAFMRITGFRNPDQKDSHRNLLHEYIDSNEANEFIHHATMEVNKHGIFHTSMRIQDRDGSILTSSVIFFAQSYTDGQTDFVGIARDVTLLQEAQRRVRILEQRFQSLFASPIIGIAISSKTPPLRIVEANHRLLEIIGYHQQDLKRGSILWEQIVSSEDMSTLPFFALGSLGHEMNEVIELDLTRKDGAKASVMMGRVRLAPEDDACAMIVAIDVSDRVKLAEERENLLKKEIEAREKLESLNRLKDDFLITLSHELRTPLTAVLGWAEFLLQNDLSASNPEQYRSALSTIKKNTIAEVKLIDDLLDISKIISGNLPLELDVHPVDDFIRETLESLKPAIEAKGIVLRYQNEEGPIKIRCDYHRIKQVLWNIIGNAIKFTPAGGDIGLSVAKSDQNLKITCEDSGIGVAPDFIGRIFDRFSQADSTMTRKFGGLGLGLAICKNIVEMHGGTIHINSPGLGRGTQVSVEIPLSLAESPKAPALVPKPEPMMSNVGSIDPEELKNVSILVIEDDVTTLEIMATILRSVGAQVETATSGQEGILKLRKSPPELLLCDIGLPDQTGYELISQLRKDADPTLSNIPAIAVTAYASQVFQDRAVAAGFQEYVTKPLSPSKLVHVANQLIKSVGSLSTQKSEPPARNLPI